MSTQSMENDHRDSSDLELLAKLAAHTRRAEALDDDTTFPFWFRVRVWLVAFTGFFTDCYDIFAINLANLILGFVYGPSTAKPSDQVLETQAQVQQPSNQGKTNQYIRVSKKNNNKKNRRVPKSKKFN